jgi:hypothetical protein
MLGKLLDAMMHGPIGWQLALTALALTALGTCRALTVDHFLPDT